MRTDLTAWFDEEEFIHETCHQINKDLTGLSHDKLDIHQFILNNPLEEISMSLVPILEEIQASNYLMQFIYRVDLGEVNYKASLRTSDFSTLAKKCIEREAQKVFLRRKFKPTFE